MKFHVDSLVTRDSRLFAYGWAFDPEWRIKGMRLRVLLRDGSAVSLPVSREKDRPDVARAFTGAKYARNSGWMTYCAWSGGPASTISLVGELENGRDFSCSLFDGGTTALPGLAPSYGMTHMLRGLRKWWGRRQWRASSRLPGTARVSAGPDPGDVATRSINAADLPGRIQAALGEALASVGQERFILVIDHSMGGGANQFSARWLAQRLCERPLALVLSFEITTLRYTIEIVSADGVQQRIVFEEEPASALAASGLVDAVLYNDAVSFPRPADVPSWLVAFARQPGMVVTLAVHDYLPICPSQFLLNDAGRFCRVPEIEECLRCLPRNDNEFARLFPSHSMPDWREQWGAALAAADSILCFSESSKKLLLRAYPALEHSRIRIEPHPVEGFDERPVIEHGGQLHIGVVGSIGWHKGAGVIQELAAAIAQRGLAVRVTIIGSMDLPVDPSVVTATGPFLRKDLPRLITESGANVFLLPSICPETFSYVTQELMELQVPLACFDFGAPADRVGGYRLGCVLPWTNGAELLDRLTQFHFDIASEQRTKT